MGLQIVSAVLVWCVLDWLPFYDHILSSCLFLRSGTSSTNTVAGTVQNQNQPPVSQSQSCKGMFTDELHKLVDNWARDAMTLSQGKRGPKHQQQVAPQGHSYEVRLCSGENHSWNRTSKFRSLQLSGPSRFTFLQSLAPILIKHSTEKWTSRVENPCS